MYFCGCVMVKLQSLISLWSPDCKVLWEIYVETQYSDLISHCNNAFARCFQDSTSNMFKIIRTRTLAKQTTSGSFNYSSHYLSLTSPLQVPLRDSRRPGLTEPRPVGGSHTFLTAQGHGGLPRMRYHLKSSIPGPTPRQHKHERRCTLNTHTQSNEATMK